MVLQPGTVPGTFKTPRPRYRPRTVQQASSLRSARPLITSLEDPARMASLRSKASLINSLYYPPDTTINMPRQFSSYYKSPSKNNRSYYLTSHENNIKPSIVPAYSSIVQDVQWEPTKKETRIVTFKEACVDVCEDCDEIKDGSRNPQPDNMMKPYDPEIPSRDPNHRVVFKDNIMRFRDQATMTLKLNDACCGNRTPVRSEESLSMTHVGIQDTPENIPLYSYQIPLAYEPPYEHQVKEYSPPILRKNLNHSFHHNDQYMKLEPVLMEMEAERDIVEVQPHVCELELKPKTPGTTRVLYNEGIDDDVKETFHLPLRLPAPVNVQYDKNKVTLGKHYRFNETEASIIPYSHRYDSKYHSACKHDPVEDTSKKLFNSRPPRPYHCEVNQCRNPSGPKRVLQSDQDIDTYIDIHMPKLIMPRRKK